MIRFTKVLLLAGSALGIAMLADGLYDAKLLMAVGGLVMTFVMVALFERQK